MSLLNGLLGQLAANVDIENLAQKVGLSPEHVEMAVTALGKAHVEPGDTAESAAAATGLPIEKLQEVIAHIGGEGALGQFASLLQDQGGAEKLLGGLASSLFGKR